MADTAPESKSDLASTHTDSTLLNWTDSPSNDGGISAMSPICRRNVRAMMAFQLCFAIVFSCALGPVFDRYLYYLGGGAAIGPTLMPRHRRNSLVGMAESISGITSLVAALPVGLLVDKHPDKRARWVRCSAILGFTGAAVAVVAVLTDVLMLVYVALILMGFFSELANSATEAIFTDSVPKGQRSGLFTTKAILSSVGAGCGPMLSAAGLWFIGDTWQPYQMKFVIVGGLLTAPICSLSLFFFQDPPAVEEESDENQSAGAASPEMDTAEHSLGANRKHCGALRPSHVPWILSLADFITCIGAGMTVKFFNLFFVQDEGFTPIDICILQTIYPLVIAGFMKLTQGLSKPLGRAQASLLFFSCNVLCLALMGELTWLPLLLVIFLVRGGFANSTYPIDRSILMDFTPSSQRGRWNAVESLTSMTWSGSAFLGGMLSDSHDYRFTFLITALVYGTACVVYSPLLKLVPRREAEMAVANAREVSLVTE